MATKKKQIPDSDFELELTAGSVSSAMTAAGATKGPEVRLVPRDSIHVLDGFNPRVTGTPAWTEHIDELSTSIKQHGYYSDKPLAGFVAKDSEENDTIWVTDGHSRLEAYDKAVAGGMEPFPLPIMIKPKGTSMEDLNIALVRSNEGKRLTPYEFGIVAKRMTAFSHEPKAIAKMFGVTPRYIDDLLVLMASPKGVRELVALDKVSAGLAIEMIRKHGDKALEKLKAGLETAKAAGKTKMTGKHVEKSKKKGEKATKLDKGDTNSGDAIVLSADDSFLRGVLLSLTVLEAKRSASTPAVVRHIDELVAKIVELVSPAELARVSIDLGTYVGSGLVRLGLVVLNPDDAPPDEPPADAAPAVEDRASEL